MITTSYSQGNISGTISDSLTSQSLIGANVIVVGTSFGAATDIEGNYRLNRIPEGPLKLRITYIGYKAKEINVSVVKDRTLDLDVTLAPDIVEGETVIVSAQAAGQVAAINQQLSSNTIVNIVSEEKIQELPDANAAEAIGRLPGVSIIRSGGEANKIILRGLSDQYTSITIDGVQIPSTDATGRGIDLSTISQGSLAGIEMFKALTSDKDADAIAGSVNLVTKKAPEERLVRVMLKGGYNDLEESASQYDFSLRYGERFFDNKFGLQLAANLEDKIRSSEAFSINYDRNRNNQTSYFINQFEIEYTDEERSRHGFGLIFDYDTPDDGNIKLNNQYYFTKRDYLTHQRDYPNGGGNSQYGSGVTYTYRDREQELNTLSSALTGNNHLFGLNVNWGMSYAESVSDFPYDYQMEFSEGSRLGEAGMATAPLIQSHPEDLIEYAYNNFASAALGGAFYRTQNNFDKNKSIFLDLLREYNLSNSISGEIKFGGKFKEKSKLNRGTLTYGPYYVNKWRPFELLPDGTTRPKDLSNTSFSEFFELYQQNRANNLPSFSYFLDDNPKNRKLYDLYDMYPLINRDLLREWYDLNKNGIGEAGSLNQLEYLDVGTASANDYNVTESVTSFYVMNSLNFGQSLVLLTGLRVEQENNDYKNKFSFRRYASFPASDFSLDDTTSNYTETIWLPNIQLNYKATDFLNVRLAAYRALARPDFTMRLNTFFAFRDPFTGSSQELILGNPILKTAKAWNFEINTSFYGNDIGLISLSGFYKRIDDMYHMLNQINTTDTTLIRSLGLQADPLHQTTYQLTVPYNSPKASHVWGFEFEHQINLMFLPSFLQHFVLSYNLSFVKSETTLIGVRTDTTYTEVEILPGVIIQNPEYTQVPIEVTQQLEEQPELFGNVSLGYDDGTFSARVSLFHQSEYNLSFSPTGRSDRINGSFTKLDMTMKYQFTDNISVQLNVNNLTNVKEEDFLDDKVNGYRILRNSQIYGLTADFGIRVDL
jgi:TonB-dependent receptor